MNTVNLGALGQFVVVHFEKGNNLDNCTLTVDGAEINSACTDVSTDGSIVKVAVYRSQPEHADRYQQEHWQDPDDPSWRHEYRNTDRSW